MILVNINQSGADAVTDTQFREAAEGQWKISDQTMRIHGDYVAAVRQNTIRGVWRVVDHRRDSETEKVGFTLAPAPEAASLIGENVPTPWVRGAANPVKTWDWRPDRGVNRSATSVELKGWTLTLLEDGAVQLVSPPDSGLLVLETLTGEVGSGVAVLRSI